MSRKIKGGGTIKFGSFKHHGLATMSSLPTPEETEILTRAALKAVYDFAVCGCEKPSPLETLDSGAFGVVYKYQEEEAPIAVVVKHLKRNKSDKLLQREVVARLTEIHFNRSYFR